MRSHRRNKWKSPVNRMSKNKTAHVLLRGGGDLATGVALRLYRTGIRLVVAELAQPLAVRRTVSFAEAVYEGQQTVEGVMSRLVKRDQLQASLDTDAEAIPVLIDPEVDILRYHPFSVVVDARLIKLPPLPLPVDVPLHIGLGPGFHAGENCHAVIETRRSHTLGRVYWIGTTQPDSGEPEGDGRRVLRAPVDGVLMSKVEIGQHVEEGQEIAVISGQWSVVSPFAGVLRGLIHDGLPVTRGLKIGDVDDRNDASACSLVSDKALAIGGGVLEAILSKEEIRNKIYG
jgi:xanthine dehydrogenase accessory factor